MGVFGGLVKKILLCACALFMQHATASDFSNAKNKYPSIPKSTLDELKWIEPYDETYLPYNYCFEPNSIKVTNLQEKVDSFWDNADSWWEQIRQDHGYCLFSIVKVSYKVICANKLEYSGEKYIFSDDKCLKSGWTHGNFSSDENKFLKNAHDWQPLSIDSLKADGNISDFKTSFRTWKYENSFNEGEIKSQWAMQKVAYPEWKYMGEPGKKIARPVLFVHGLNDDYETWGVESTIDKKNGKNNPKFQNGLVKKYTNGSAPDILARMLNIDNTEDNINHNGIYFFQSPGMLINDTWYEAQLAWNSNDATKSQSRKLYNKLESLLDDFCIGTGIDWRQTPELKVDIVAHSQGGLVVREMLRGLQLNAGSFPVGSANAANHIGKLITLDTPHLGAATAALNSSSIDQYYGLGKLIDDFNAFDLGETRIHKLMNLQINVDYSNPLSYLLTNVATKFFGLLGFAAVTADYNVRMSGQYLGPYKINFNVDLLGPWDFDVYHLHKDFLKSFREQMIETRKLGEHLYSNSEFMTNLNSGKNGESYPKLPNGNNLVLLPMYSDNVSPIVIGLLKTIADDLKIVCSKIDDNLTASCVALETYIDDKANDFIEKYTLGVVNSEIDISNSLITILNDIQETWLTNSDLIVEAESQKYAGLKYGISPNNIKELMEPRSYLFHDALAPWETVMHMRESSIEKKIHTTSVTLQGFDISCALDFYCDELLGKKLGAKLVHLDSEKVEINGNFDVAPIFTNEGMQSLKVSDGVNFVEATYAPNIGSFVNYTDTNGVIKNEFLASEKIATMPRLKRNGDTITALLNNYSGKSFFKNIILPKMAKVATLSVSSNNKNTLPKIMAGIGDFNSSQNSPIIPKNSLYAKQEIFVMHRESREKYETNTSRPRILIANSSDKNINGFKVAYYFTADSARIPIVEVDYPQIPIIVEHLGSDNWRFILDASDSILKAKSVFPNLDGWQIRIHYNDWTDYNFLNDWSADYSAKVPKVNKKIIVYDTSGNIIWGEEPEIKIERDTVFNALVTWVDAAPWELNMFKPQITIKNTGSEILNNYHVKLWINIPAGKQLNMPVDDWYTPVSVPSLMYVAENVWELDLHFDKYILYPGDSVTEGNIGIHLSDWSIFNKNVCGLILQSSEGLVIYGELPDIERCKTYNNGNLLQYAWSY